MSRPLRPDARTLAYADAPIFPFLAPRAFPESPFRHFAHTHNRYEATRSQKDKEKANSGRDVNILRKARWCKRSHLNDTVQPAYAPKTPVCRSTTRSSPIPSSRRTLYQNTRPSIYSASSSLRYADLFSLTQTQLAKYSTESNLDQPKVDALTPHTRNGGTTRPWRRRIASRQLDRPGNLSELQSVPSNTSSAQFKTTLLRVRTKDGALLAQNPQMRSLLNRRRIKALVEERKRYETLLSYKPTTNITKLMLDGRYRSLRRRLFALRCPDIIQLNMPWRDDMGGPSVLLEGLAALDYRVYRSRKRCSHFIKIQHHPRVEEYALRLCKDVTASKTDRMWNNWVGLDEGVRNASWDLILLFLLDQRPEHALQFIRVLAQEPFVTSLKPALLADALEHIARLRVRNKKGKLVVPDTSDLVPTFTYVFREHLAKHRAMSTQDLLWNIGRLATLDDLRLVFDLLMEKRAWIGYDTLLHYANKFGNAGDHEYAIRCLQRTLERSRSEVAGKAMVARRRFQWSCALILRQSASNGQDYHFTTPLVAEFLKLGVKLDILLYNVIMSNAMEAGDQTTAFKVFNILEENGAKPDKYTYSILLHGCTMASDPAKFRAFTEHCAEKAKELKDPWLATDYLYYLYVRHDRDDPHHLWASLSHAYLRLFTPGPLQYFAQWNSSVYENQDELNITRLEPPPAAVYIMLQMEIQKALSMSNAQVWNVYQYFKRVVNENLHPTINELANNPAIWNAFLLAFCRNQQFANASNLIKDMTQGDPSKIPQPNVYSWNIFMQAFFKTDQVRAADRIYEMMRSRGIEPDQFTYGVLLRGYVRAQHTEKIGEIMGHIDNEQQLSPQVLQALTRVADRKRLMYELEKSRQAKDEEKRIKLEAKEEERRKRWEHPQFKSMLSRPRLSLPDAQDLSRVRDPEFEFLQDQQSQPSASGPSSSGSSDRPTLVPVSQSATSNEESTIQSDSSSSSKLASPKIIFTSRGDAYV